jgi:DNA repair protein RadC
MASKAAKDIRGNYNLSIDKDEDILAAAESILLKRVCTGDYLSDPTKASELLRMRLGALDHEVFCVIFLTTRHQVISVENIFRGTIDGAEIHPREICKRALELNAAAIIISHNHPSGNPAASAADKAVTARIKAAAGLLDIRLLDHIIVAGAAIPTSMASQGWV